MKRKQTLKKLVEENLGLSSRYRRYPIADIESIRTLIESAKHEQKPIKLLYFWGVAHKTQADSYDRKAMSFLKNVVEKIKNASNTEGVLTLLLTDLHGFANGFPPEQIATYYRDIQELATLSGFKTLLLSSLFTDKEREDLYHSPTDAEAILFREKWEQLQQGGLKTGTEASLQTRTLRYMLVRLREQKRIESHFTDTILLCGDKEESHYQFPKMPKICIYNSGLNLGHKAWLWSTENHH